jgi:hypothetical protein
MTPVHLTRNTTHPNKIPPNATNPLIRIAGQALPAVPSGCLKRRPMVMLVGDPMFNWIIESDSSLGLLTWSEMGNP